MLSKIHSLLNKLKYTPLHPQWIANRSHLKKLSILSTLRQKTVLNVGSGNFDLSNYLDSSCKLISLDYFDTAQRYDSPPDIYGDAQTLPIKSNSIDVIVIMEVLEHIPDYKKTVNEIHRTLKPGGECILSVPFMYPLHDEPYDFSRFTLHGLKNIFSPEKFCTNEISPLSSSLDSILQLINLFILYTLKNLEKRSTILIILLAIPCYLICLANNLLSIYPSSPSNSEAFNLGYTASFSKVFEDQ